MAQNCDKNWLRLAQAYTIANLKICLFKVITISKKTFQNKWA